jgi:hypothetical protein
MPWIKDCKLLHEVEGSDHLPLILDLHDEIAGPDGRELLFDELNGGRPPKDPPPKPPLLAAKYRKVAPSFSPPLSPPKVAHRLSASQSRLQSAVPHAQASNAPVAPSAWTKTAENPASRSTTPAQCSFKSTPPLTTIKKPSQLEIVDLTQDDSDDEIQIITPRSKRNRQSLTGETSKASSHKLLKSEK